MTNHLIPDAELAAKLRANVQELRRTPKPLAEVIPLLISAADALDRAAAQVGAKGAADEPKHYNLMKIAQPTYSEGFAMDESEKSSETPIETLPPTALNDVLLLIGKAVIDLRNNCKNDDFLVRHVTRWLEAAEKILEGKSVYGAVQLHSSIAAGAPAETPKPVYFVRYPVGGDGWREASEDAYHTFSEPNRRILYTTSAATIGAGEGKDAARLDWLDAQSFAYGFEDMHEGNRWSIDGPFASIRAAIDAAMRSKTSPGEAG